MGLGGISIWQILIILVIVLLLFGGTKRIKNLGSDLANTIKSFRKTLDEEDNTTWAPINLSGATVKLRIREVGKTTVLSTITCTITDASNGVCTLTFPSGTWTTAGTFEGEIEHTTSGSGIQTVQDFIKFKVRDDFD